MYTSRFSRIEESKQKKRLIIAIVGSIAIVMLLAIFGVKLIIGFSILVDTLRGSSATALPTQAILQPPILDPLPIATKSGSLTITGSGKSGLTAIVYVNDAEAKKTIVGRSSTFTVLLPGLKDGQNTISAKLTDNKGTFSDISNIVTTTIKDTPPVLELDSPQDHATQNGDDNKVTISGKTEDNTSVTANGRFIVINSNNTFTYQYPLNEGDNKITVIVTDQAGNTTQLERIVTYHK